MSARILVVDDTPANVRLLEAKLTAEYFSVVTATSGKEALSLIAQNLPDVLLLDVMMPDMDGYEVCRILREDSKTRYLPIIMITALGDPVDKMRGLNAGADDFLTKPISDLALFARIRSLVRYKSTMDEWRIRQDTAGIFLAGEIEDNLESQNVESHTEANLLVVAPIAGTEEMIARALDQDKHRIEIAKNIAEATSMAAAENAQYDLVILDIQLQQEDGLRLVSIMRARPQTRQCPILILANATEGVKLLKGLDIGASDYVIKPIDPSELLARVRLQVRRHRFQVRLKENLEKSLSMALTDSLTGLYNRRYATRHLENLLSRAQQTGKPVSILACDIDHFKLVNDTYGHPAGDEVLKKFAEHLSQSVRAVDMVARFGGEEFIILLPDIDGARAVQIAERLCESVAAMPISIEGKGDLHITTSIGVASSCSLLDMDNLLKLADAALYRAKNSGRNKVLADPASLVA